MSLCTYASKRSWSPLRLYKNSLRRREQMLQHRHSAQLSKSNSGTSKKKNGCQSFNAIWKLYLFCFQAVQFHSSSLAFFMPYTQKRGKKKDHVEIKLGNREKNQYTREVNLSKTLNWNSEKSWEQVPHWRQSKIILVHPLGVWWMPLPFSQRQFVNTISNQFWDASKKMHHSLSNTYRHGA